jgi:copper(I)-binding protein
VRSKIAGFNFFAYLNTKEVPLQRTIVFLSIFALWLAACVSAAPLSDPQAGIEISEVRVYFSGGYPAQGITADTSLFAFMQIRNLKVNADRLVGISTDFAKATLHEVKTENDKMVMLNITELDLPANALVELKYKYHIMLTDIVRKDLKVGDLVKMTLEFEKAGRITVAALVEEN